MQTLVRIGARAVRLRSSAASQHEQADEKNGTQSSHCSARVELPRQTPVMKTTQRGLMGKIHQKSVRRVKRDLCDGVANGIAVRRTADHAIRALLSRGADEDLRY